MTKSSEIRQIEIIIDFVKLIPTRELAYLNVVQDSPHVLEIIKTSFSSAFELILSSHFVKIKS